MNDCLLIKIHLLSSKVKSELTKPLLQANLTYNQWLVLKQLKISDNLCASDIVKKLDIPKGTLSGVINQLLNKKLIITSASDNDKREIKLSLTKEAFDICNDIISIEANYKIKFLHNLSETEKEIFQTILEKLD